MKPQISREELIDLVEKIMECEGSEKEIDDMMEIVKNNLICPYVSDLIFWNEEKLTPEQIVDKALEYEPIQL